MNATGRREISNASGACTIENIYQKYRSVLDVVIRPQITL